MKKVFALLLCLILAVGLVACGETPADTDTNSGNSNSVSGGGESSSDSSDEGSEWKPLENVENMVLACDQYKERLVVYDMSLLDEDGNLDEAEVWELKDHRSAGMKYREDTIYGDVVVSINGSQSPQIIEYPSKKILWEGGSGKSGINPHSIEILPSGNIVTASTTDSLLRLFYAADCVKNGAKVEYQTYQLKDVHGVLWDPEYELLWAIGEEELAAYMVVKENGKEVLKKVNGEGGELPTLYGHDLSADMMDSQYLWCTTGEKVYRFDKETGEFEAKFKAYAKLNKADVKGFGNNKNGNFFYCFPNQGPGRDWEKESLAEWCTDTIYYGYWKSENFLYLQECVSEQAAFYKVIAFDGRYQ